MKLNFAIRRHGESIWWLSNSSGLFISKMDIPDPEPKTSTEDIMGISGLLDFSEVNGLCFHNRLITLECKLAEGATFNARDFKSNFLGRVVDLIILKDNTIRDEDLYYTGRLKVSKNELYRRDPKMEIVVDAAPFRHYVSAEEKQAGISVKSILARDQILLNEISEGDMSIVDDSGFSHTIQIADDGVVTLELKRGEGLVLSGGCTIYLPTMSSGKYLLWCEETGGHCSLEGMDQELYSNTYESAGLIGSKKSFCAAIAPGRDVLHKRRGIKFKMNSILAATGKANFRLALYKINPETVTNNGDLSVMPDFELTQDALVYLNDTFFIVKSGDDWNPYLQLRPGENNIAAFGMDTQSGSMNLTFEEEAF